MLQERLLERLSHIEENPEYRGMTDPAQVTSSIMEHLQRILNTRQGNAQIDYDYGVPDFTDMAANFSTETVRDLIAEIRRVIQKYEPRLTDVNLVAEKPSEGQLELRFKIEGRLAGDQRSMTVSFETIVDPDGQIQIRD
jgi:type VI secretion system protein